MTFLYRAPKIQLQPLNLTLIAAAYAKIFELENDKAREMANLTCGYPFAFQVLGYLCYRNKTTYENVMTEYDCYLEEYVYEKIWSEMSELDRIIASAIAESEASKVADIRRMINVDSNIYKRRVHYGEGALRPPIGIPQALAPLRSASLALRR